MLKRVVLTAILAAALAWPAAAQEKGMPKKQVGGKQTASITATVVAIDQAKRELTLKGPEGNMVIMEVPESVKRFPQIKVGDHLTVKYTEALVLQLHKADPSAKLGMSEATSVQPKPGVKPSGVFSHEVTATVVVDAVDAKAPSITVREADGSTTTFRVQDARNLEGVAPGDRIVITYSEAVAISVTAPPAK